MNAIKKLNALSNEELQGVRGGAVSQNGLNLYSSDNNNRKECNCTGPGDNNNDAAKCQCSDASGCSGKIMHIQTSIRNY